MDLTKEEAIAKFREHWLWLSEHPKAEKSAAPVFEGKNIKFDCFLCHYTLKDILVRCSKCPIQWPSTAKDFMCEQAYDGDVEMHGLWPQWQNAHDNKDYTTASALALQIANLPERIDMAEVEEFLEREG